MSGSASVSGKTVSTSWSYQTGRLANYNNGGFDYFFNYSTSYINNQYAGAYGGSGSFSVPVGYNQTVAWDTRAYYNKGSTTGPLVILFQDTGSVSTGSPPAPSAPPTPSLSGSGSPGFVSYSWSSSGATGYEWSGTFNGSGGSTGTSGSVSSGTYATLSVRAYTDGDGVNTSGRSYSGYASLGVYSPYPSPSTPGTPTVSGGISGSSAVFSWNSTGGAYHVYINGSLYTNTSATSITIGSSPGATTSCYVQAYNSNPDGVTASSGTSNTASVRIPNPPAAPSAPALSGSSSGQTVSLAWNNVGASGYYVYRNGTFVTSTTSTSFSETRPLGSTTSYTVQAQNSNSDGTATSAQSNSVSVYVLNPPAAPTAPTLSATAHVNGDGTVDLSWTNTSATGYRVFRNGVQIVQQAGTTYSDTGRARGTNVTYTVQAYNTNADGTTTSGSSNAVTVTIPDLPPAPAAPTLSGSADTNTGYVTLTWNNVSAARYDVFRDGVQIGTTTSTTYVDQGNAATTTHTFFVRAFNTNAVGTGPSSQSNTVSVTIPVPPPPPPPPAPLSPTVTGSGRYQVATITWNATATGYRVFRDGVQVADVTATSFSETRPVDTYTNYYVVPYTTATNAGGSTTTTGAQSNTATVLTTALPPDSVGVLQG